MSGTRERWARARRLLRRTRAMPFHVEETSRDVGQTQEMVARLSQTQQDVARRLDEITTALDALDRSVGSVHGDLATLRHSTRVDLDHLHHAMAAIAEQAAWIQAPTPADGPVVTVICPVNNRAPKVERALASVRAQTYANWEFIVVDDGSDDLDADTIDRWERDSRVRVLRQPRHGPWTARNRALSESTGEIIAYLDSDNTFHPTYLAWVVTAMDADPEVMWTVASQLVDDGRQVTFRRDRFDVDFLATSNHLDINAVAHRRSLLHEIAGPAGFDESGDRLGDWELFQRMAAAVGAPTRIAAIGSLYDGHSSDRISSHTPMHPTLARLRARGRPPVADGLRVLVASWHYPQATETYVRADIVGLVAQGAHVEVWSQDDVAVPYDSPVPWHRGTLEDAIEAVRPDIVLTHWLNIGRNYVDIVRARGLPMTVRGHGFEFDPAHVDALLTQPGVLVQLFPHLLARYGRTHPRLRPLTVSFDQDLYPPAPDKDRALVVRVGTGIRTKDYETFFSVAEQCPEHRFVLVLGTAFRAESQLADIVALAEEMDAPVEILTDLMPEDAAEVVRRAGIYLHTHGTDLPFGMPVSIAEASATGCYVLVRDLPGAREYLGGDGDVYRDAGHAAALIQQTVHWDDDRWARTWRAASDNAHIRFGAPDVAATMIEQWREVLGVARVNPSEPEVGIEPTTYALRERRSAN